MVTKFSKNIKWYAVAKQFPSPLAGEFTPDDRQRSYLSLFNTCTALFVDPVLTSVVITLSTSMKTTRKMISSIVLISKHLSSSHDLGLGPSNTAE